MAKARDVPGLDARTPFAVAAARTVRVRSDELFEHSDGVLDTTDIERVHDMRVASRRLRAVLEVYAACFPRRQHAEVLGDVKDLADALGARRDPDVQLRAIDAFSAAVGDAERPGLEVVAASVRARQVAGNDALTAALERIEGSGLRARLAALADAAEERVA
jgi:CHAD domain-containing protein